MKCVRCYQSPGNGRFTKTNEMGNGKPACVTRQHGSGRTWINGLIYGMLDAKGGREMDSKG